MAEREGFEPPRGLLPFLLSRQTRSARLRHLSVNRGLPFTPRGGRRPAMPGVAPPRGPTPPALAGIVTGNVRCTWWKARPLILALHCSKGSQVCLLAQLAHRLDVGRTQALHQRKKREKCLENGCLGWNRTNDQ